MDTSQPPQLDIFDVSGRPALVTGASSGLGETFARVLAAAGAPVILAARRVDRLERLADEIRTAGGQAHSVALDVKDTAQISSVIDDSEKAFGPIRILVNNSGVAEPERALDVTEDSWDHVLDTNLKGAWFVAQAVARAMVANNVPGSIINIQSILSFRVAQSVATYAASKAGLLKITESTAIEWASKGIRVNGISPGYIETDMNREYFETEAGQRMINKIPQKRLGQPTDLAGALLLLASDASGFMTGSTIVVDGGHLTNSL